MNAANIAITPVGNPKSQPIPSATQLNGVGANTKALLHRFAACLLRLLKGMSDIDTKVSDGLCQVRRSVMYKGGC